MALGGRHRRPRTMDGSSLVRSGNGCLAGVAGNIGGLRWLDVRQRTKAIKPVKPLVVSIHSQGDVIPRIRDGRPPVAISAAPDDP